MVSRNNIIHTNDSFLDVLPKVLTDKNLVLGLLEQTRLDIKGTLNKPKDNFDHSNNAPSLILVPGFGCGFGVMSYLGGILNEKYNVFYAPDFLMHNTGDIQVSGTLLSNKVVEILKNYEKNGDLYIIGHSLGGLIAIESLKNGKFKINKLITGGTPFLGTPVGSPFTFIKAIRQIQEFKSSIFGKLSALSPNINEMQQHISSFDNFVPSDSQSTSKIFVPLSLKEKIKVIEHPFTHTDFITNIGAREFAESIG